MELVRKAREVVGEAGRLLCRFLCADASEVLWGTIANLPHKLSKRFLYILKVLGLEIHVATLGLMDCDLTRINSGAGKLFDEFLTRRSELIF